MNEAETRAEHVDPALAAAGWRVVEGSRFRRALLQHVGGYHIPVTQVQSFSFPAVRVDFNPPFRSPDIPTCLPTSDLYPLASDLCRPTSDPRPPIPVWLRVLRASVVNPSGRGQK